MNENSQPKTITFQRTRKVNPALIDPRYQYGSEEVTFGAWADVSNDADLQKATEDLTAYVEGIMQEKIEELVLSLRTKAKRRNYYWAAIEPAFIELMLTQNLSEAELKIALDRFMELLEQEMKSLEV